MTSRVKIFAAALELEADEVEKLGVKRKSYPAFLDFITDWAADWYEKGKAERSILVGALEARDVASKEKLTASLDRRAELYEELQRWRLRAEVAEVALREAIMELKLAHAPKNEEG